MTSATPAQAALRFEPAVSTDAAALAGLVVRAYGSTDTWTSESWLAGHVRISESGVLAKIADRDVVFLVGRDSDGRIVACCTLTRSPGEPPELGLFAVEPALQASGLGRVVLQEAERVARTRLGATAIAMRVLSNRRELLDWYRRRGYVPTGREVPFATVKPDGHRGLVFLELRKSLT